MDSFLAIVRRVTALCAVALCGLLFAPSAFAGYADLGSAYSACQTAYQQYQSQYPASGFTEVCVYHGPGTNGWTGGGYNIAYVGPPYSSFNSFFGTMNPTPPAPGANVCAQNAPHAQQWRKGKILAQYKADIGVADPVSGQTVKCQMVLNPATPPMQDSSGQWWTYIVVGPAGQGIDPAPLPAGQVTDKNGAPASPPINDYPGDAAGVNSSAGSAPKVCGGMSCNDPNTGNACAMVSGAQLCVQGPTSPAAPGGNCFAAGDGSACIGNPAPAPDPKVIPDPATQIKGSDKYTMADPVTGQVATQTVNIFSNGGQTVSSGKGANDLGPASSSSSASAPKSFGGGGDCNTPPVCSGDAVLCGVATQQWRTMCSAKTSADQLYKGLAGDGNGPPTFAADSTKYNQSSVWSQPDTSLDGTVGGQANNGVYDQSGFGFNTKCPLTDLNIPFFGGSFAIPLSNGCVIGPWVKWLLIGFALYAAYKITAGGVG